MSADGDGDERWAVFRALEDEWLRLLLTIVAMANSGGGRIRLERVEGEPGALDEAALGERLRACAAPPLRGVAARRSPDGSVEISVPASESRPHVFSRDGVAAGTGQALFRAGQVWLRGGGGNRLAGGEEIHQLVRETAAAFLGRLSVGLRDPSFSFRLTEEGGVPVHLADDEESVPVSPNLARLYPYTTKSLGEALGRTTNWAATAAKVLRLKADREYAYGVPAPGGRVIQWRYSERALARLREKLAHDPGWNPYHAL